jgi:formate hydrogenlyase subunit 4
MTDVRAADMGVITAAVFQLLQSLLVMLAAPLLLGWVNTCRAWLHNRTSPGLLQPYRSLHKLFQKDAAIAANASWVFRFSPYIQFGCMWLAAAIVPAIATDLPFSPAADVIALVGVFAVARVFAALAGMDIGTAFGMLGSRRETLVGALAEPALLVIFFNMAAISHSTSLVTIVQTMAREPFVIHPSLAFAAVAFVMVLLAENARIPVDNPATHLELTMIHEAMVLEYSARHLALIDWAASIKLFVYCTIGIALFLPWGIPAAGNWGAVPLAVAILCGKLAIAGAGLALLEALSAKMRVFRMPEFLATAFLLAMLGLLLRFSFQS